MLQTVLLAAFLPLLLLGLVGGIAVIVWGRRARFLPMPAARLSTVILAGVAMIQVALLFTILGYNEDYDALIPLLVPVVLTLLPMRSMVASARAIACGIAALLLTGFSFLGMFSVGPLYAATIPLVLLAGVTAGLRRRVPSAA